MEAYLDEHEHEATRAEERFVDVALYMVNESMRQEYELDLMDEYSNPKILNNHMRGVIDNLVKSCIDLINKIAEAEEDARKCSVPPDVINGPPSRDKVRALNEYSDRLEWVCSWRRRYRDEFNTLCQEVIFRDNVSWSQNTRQLFEWSLSENQNRVTLAYDRADRIEQVARVQAAHPGHNPRKTRGISDGVNIADAIAKDLENGPFELQHGRPSYIPAGNWVPAFALGGGMAQVALYVDVDEAGYIKNRLVRKDTHIRTNDWTNMTKWAGNMNTTNLDERWPMEYYCQGLAAHVSEAHVVKPLKCEVDAQKSVFRIYLPYCPYGDLSKLITHYQMNNMRLPEAFIWRVFQVLCEAGEIMEKGHLPDLGLDQAGFTGWRQIVHRDLKTNNVFLDASGHRDGSNKNSQWPHAKLADFGLAILTTPDDPLNPRLYNRGAGTEGFYPPEQQSYVDKDTRESVDNFQLLAHTNVWGIGAIVWCLAYLHDLSGRDQPSYLPSREDNDYRPRYTIEVPDDIDADYLSPELRNMIDECLRFEPWLRPTFSQLRTKIDSWIQDHSRDGDVGQFLFAASRGDPTGDDVLSQHTLWGVVDKDYRVGFALDGEREAYRREHPGRKGSQVQYGGAAQ